MKNSILSLAEKYLQFPTAPFREDNIRQFITLFCTDRDIPFFQDPYGNLIITYGKSKSVKAHLTFVAHMDHPGFIAEKKSRANKTTALFYGGWDPTEFEAARIRFFPNVGESVSAIALRWQKSKKEKAWRAFLSLDGSIQSGDIGMWDFKPYNIKKNYLYSRSCDDSIGCILLLALLDFFNNRKTQISFSAIFTSAEEAGLHGAKFLCHEKEISKNFIPISVETSRELPVARIDDGVIIRVGDSRSIFSPEISASIVNIAQKIKATDKAFKFQRKLMDGGQCEGSVFSKFGYRTGALSIPLGNYHNRNFTKKTTAPEYVSIDDIMSAFTLMKEMVEKTDKFLFGKGEFPKYKREKGTLGQEFFIEST